MATTRADSPLLSLVVPAWNEAVRLPALLSSVRIAEARWQAACGSDRVVECIVADNASTDATAAIAEAAGCRVVPVPERAIAAARNAGAAAATGDWLAFVDADSRLHPEVFVAIETALRDPRVLGGASGVTMERWSAGIALTYAFLLPMVWLTGFDTGVVFCRRADFEAAGGFDSQLRAAEDLDFLHRWRRLGRQRGQHSVRLRRVKTITSTRKFDQHGDWHWFWQMPAIAIATLLKLPGAARRIQRYWYEGR